MTDRIQKNLNKLSNKDRRKIKKLLVLIKTDKWAGLDLKKLKNRDKIFRVRKGDFRIIFKKDGNEIFLLIVERRSDNTYENF